MPKKPNLPMITDLKAAALEATRRGSDLEAAIILFQLVEVLLRITVRVEGRQHGVDARVLERCADNEQRFARLILYLDLIRPGNELSAPLKELNTRRNSIVHKLSYEFGSIEELRDELSSFCEEAVRVNQAIIRFLGVDTDERA